MSFLEKIASRIRHFPGLRRLNFLWNSARPVYKSILRLFFRKGLPRAIDGLGKIYICHECRTLAIPAPHEIEWWKKIALNIREGDTIVDIGAFIGIFTITMARRAGKTGRVIAFEPNPKNLTLCRKNIILNNVSGQVELLDIAIGNSNGPARLSDEGSASHIVSSAMPGGAGCLTVKSDSLDEILKGRKVDIIKIDTEGYEADVLSGAKDLLRRKDHTPRLIFIECHPYMWKSREINSNDIVTPLQDAGYTIEMPELPDNKRIDDIDHHWAIFASRNSLA